MELGLAAHRADAAKVKHYIRSLGGAAKTDPIDARWLTRYGQEHGASLVRWQAPEAERDTLASLVRLRQDLVGQRTAAKNRRAAPCNKIVAGFLDKQIRFLNDQIAQLDKAIAQLLKTSAALADAAQRLRRHKGFGPVAVSTMLALMPELGRLNRRQAVSLARLAPHPNDSGLSHARRRTGRGGRDGLKPALFRAALTAAKHNQTLKIVYQRLIAAGKPKRLALVAIARKLILLANAALKPTSQLT